MDGRGSPAVIGPWDPSFNNGPHHFSPGGVCVDGRKGTMGGTDILSSSGAARVEDQTTRKEGGAGPEA